MLAVFLLAGSARAAGAEWQVVSEYTAKAGFLAAFTHYVTWPPHTFRSPGDSIELCILGRDPFGGVLDATASATRGLRPLVVRRIADPGEVSGCHVAFIPRLESAREAEWLKSFGNRPVLVVGESGRTVERGGVVQFLTIGDRVAFDVDVASASRLGIKVSADLLAHARRVFR